MARRQVEMGREGDAGLQQRSSIMPVMARHLAAVAAYRILTRELSARGIDHLLLKGPHLAATVYDKVWERDYPWHGCSRRGAAPAASRAGAARVARPVADSGAVPAVSVALAAMVAGPPAGSPGYCRWLLAWDGQRAKLRGPAGGGCVAAVNGSARRVTAAWLPSMLG
jgi:hypothetical protein